MTGHDIIAKINDYLYKATSNLSQWLETKLPKLTDISILITNPTYP